MKFKSREALVVLAHCAAITKVIDDPCLFHSYKSFSVRLFTESATWLVLLGSFRCLTVRVELGEIFLDQTSLTRFHRTSVWSGMSESNRPNQLGRLGARLEQSRVFGAPGLNRTDSHGLQNRWFAINRQGRIWGDSGFQSLSTEFTALYALITLQPP